MDHNQNGLPPILRDFSKQRENKLAKRLYKNNSMKKLNSTAEFSYLRNINPDSSILASGGTLSKNNSSKNLLIPSVSLKRNKQHDLSQRSLQITQGKILLSSPKNQQPNFLHFKGDLKYQLQKTSAKTLFKKINRYDGINEKKIIPDQLLGCSSDQQQSKLQRFENSPKNSNNSNKGIKILKGFKNQSSSINQDDQTLTPNDFIQLIQQDGTITNQFCYLKKMSHPYDLKIVEFQGNMPNLQNPANTIKPSMLSPTEQYITISSRGVSYFSQQNSRFVPLERWKKEAHFFNKLMNLQFFSKYRLFKNFAKWKKHIRKTAMKSTTDKLRNQLMIGDKFLRKALLSVKDSCFIMQNDTNYCKFDDCQNVMQFPAFKSCQQQFIQNEFEKRIVQIEEDIKNNLISNMSDSMRQFKEQNKISTSNQGKGIPLLIGDQKNLDMPYTKQATLRIQQQKFKKFLKLIQFMIVDSKIKMMNQSTQKTVKKMQQENQNYQKQVIESKYKFPFKGKQYIKCAIKINVDEQTITLKPTREDLNYMFEQVVNRAIVKLCRNHKRIINDDEILEIIYDSNEKIVKQSETNILKVIIMGDDRQQKIVNSLNQAINITYSYLQTYSNRFSNLVEMYFDNLSKLNAINTYQAKDHQIIMQSLQNWKNQLTQINTLSQQHQSSIFLLDFQQFKTNAIKCVTQCFQKMKKVMPQIFVSTTENLLTELELCQQKMRIKPVQIQDFIEFQKNKNQITNKMQDYADKLAQINCIWIIMKSYSSSSQITNISRQERQINRLQTKLNNLRTRLQQAQMNTKSYETNAQQLLKSRIPLIKQDIYKLYMKIKNSKFDVNSKIDEVSRSIEDYQYTHDHILQSIKQLKEFQQQLSMQEYNEETMTKFSLYFFNYKKIWKLHESMQEYKSNIMNQLWTTINIQEAKKQVEAFFNEALKLKKQITTQSADDEQFKVQLSDIDVLSYVFLQAKNMKPLMQTVQCLRDKSLGQKQWKQIKSHFQKINKQQVCLIIDIENRQATISSIQQFKISEQLDFIQNIVFRSKKQLQIHNKMIMVNKFWIQSNSSNAGKNLADNFKQHYLNIITEIDQKITVINGISQDSQIQAQQLKQNISQNKAMLDTLRVLLTEWETHQGYLSYFKPIFENTYWKSNTKQSKLYSQAQNNWKKLLKQCKDYSLKRWASNEKAIATLRQNIILFEALKKVVEDFLTVKRDIFPKFYFLSNQELLHVLICEKQIRSIQEHINKFFTCIKSLEAKELGQIVVSTDSQNIQVKFSKAFNSIQVQQIFKTLQESIKSSIKTNLRNCLTNFQKDDFNKKKWIKDHLLQSLLFIQKSQYTKIIQYDYMGQDPEDLSQYLIYQNGQIKQLQTYLRDHSQQSGLHVGKLQTLILQQILHRQVTQMLLKNHITEEQSYDWQKQIRCYYSIQNAISKFFVNQIEYGYEFVNLQNSYPYMILSQKEAIDLTMSLKLKNSPVIKGRQNLVLHFSKFNAKYHRSILCHKNLSQKYLANVCFGGYLEGCFIEFQKVQNLQINQLSVVANFLKQIYSAINRKDKTFNFGWKKNPLNFNAGIVLKLSDTESMIQFTQKIPFPNKGFEFKSLPYELYVNLMMQVRKKNCQNLGSKLIKFIDLITDLEGYQIFHFENIKKLVAQQSMKEVQNYQAYFVQQIINLISEKIVSLRKITFYKKILIEIFFQDKNIFEFSTESIAQNSKINKDKSDFKFIVNSLVEITDKKSICVIAGPTQSGKVSVISEAYKQRISRGFQLEILSIDILSQESLFGCYVSGLWRQGILIKKIKQLPLSKQEWIVFQGSQSQKTIDVMRRLNHNYLQLSNGQLVFLSKQWKFIFSIYNLDQNSNNLQKNIDLIQSTKFINIQDSIQVMIEKRIKPHFQKDAQNKNLDNFNQLSNKCVNKVESILDKMKSVGLKNDYLKSQNIIRYFINILDAILSGISTQIKVNKQFSKGIQKIFIWSIYWSIISGLPTQSANRYQKLISQLIKSDIQRSQNISFLKLEFDTPVGNLKKIKNPQIKLIKGKIYVQTLDLKSKANFAQTMIKGNFPIILIGKTGSGKTKFMQYIQTTLNSDEYTYLPIKLRKQMSYEQFKDILFKKTRISIKYHFKKCFCSSTNKRLVILIDDFNLLDINSAIGQFLTTCIKNGYYYDVLTNEKIYIYNISFVVAENQTYEFRIDNRFLKYFKPVYINEIELKDIAQVYKQDLVHVQHSRQIFDACVSLHNFVNNLQSNGQIKREFAISHHNAIRIMECLKDYSSRQIKQSPEGKQKRESLAKTWGYVSKLQYTGYSLSAQVQQKIQKQIKNLLNLIIQNSNQKPKPVPLLQELLQDLINNFNLIKADGQYQQYYEFLSFLLTLTQPHNLLTIGQPLPEVIKTQILKYTADIHSLKYHYAKDVETLKNIEFRNTLIYISTENFNQMIKIIGFVTNNVQCKLGRFIIDCQNNTEFHRLIKYVPSICSMFHIFTKKISLSKILISSQYSQWLNKLQSFLENKLSQREQLSIISNLLSRQKYLKGFIIKKKKLADQFIQRYHKLNQDIQNNVKLVQQITINIKVLKQNEQTVLITKKQMSEQLTGLRNTKLQDQQEEQRIQKIKKLQQQINNSQLQVKNIKTKKKQYNQSISNLQTTNTLSKQISKKLFTLYQQFLQTKKLIQNLQDNQNSIIFCLTLYYFGIKSNNQQYLSFIEKQSINKIFDINHSLKIIFDINTTQMNKQIFIWAMENKTIIVKDKNNRFLRAIKKAIPKLRIINDIHTLNHHYTQPIIYTGKYDTSIVHINSFTYVIESDISQIHTQFKQRTILAINDSISNQRQTIKSSLYTHKQKQLSYQIFNYQQQIYQLHLQILQDQDKAINVFLDPKQHDLKKLKSLLYTQWERLKGLQNSLLNIQIQLDKKYGTILDTCRLFKQLLMNLQENVGYLHFSDKKFQDIIFKSIHIQTSTQKTRKKLLETGLMSKKSIGITKSRKQIVTDRQLSKKNIQTNDLVNQKQTFDLQKDSFKQLKQESNALKQQCSITTFKKTMMNQVLAKIFLGLKSEDSILAYTLLACFVIQQQFLLPCLHRQTLIKILKRNSKDLSVEDMLNLEIQIQTRIVEASSKLQESSNLIQILQSIRRIYNTYKQNPNSVLQKIINFCDICLGKSFDDLLNDKYNVELLGLRQNILVVSNPNENVFQILQKQILRYAQDSNWCYMFENQLNSDKIGQMTQKCSINWVIIINNKNPKIFQQLKQIQNQKNLNFIFLYPDQNTFFEFKKHIHSIKIPSFQNLNIVYAQDTCFGYKKISQIYLNDFSKISQEKPQIEQLSRIVFYDQATQLLKKLYQNNLYQHNITKQFNNTLLNKYQISQQFYSTKVINQILISLKSLDFNHFSKILINICYCNQKQKQHLVLKQAKKIISKKQQLFNSFINFFTKQDIGNDDINYQGAIFINQNNKTLIQNFSLSNTQEIVNIFVPQQFKKKYPLDNLIFLSNKNIQVELNVEPKLQNSNNFIPQKMLAQIDKILNQFPTFCSLQSQGNKKQKYLYKDILKEQIKIKLNVLKKIQQNLKKYKKLLQIPKILSQPTQKQFTNLQKYLINLQTNNNHQTHDLLITDSFLEFLTKKQKTINYLQKFYQNKQNQKSFEPIHFKQPIQFIKYYLYESNSQISFKTGQIQARYLTQKDKQIHFDTAQECKSLLISQISVKNAKFDQNKNTLQINDKNQTSKISNVHICFNDKQINQLNSSLPVYFDNQKLFNLIIINKVKEESIWKDKIILEIPKNQ